MASITDILTVAEDPSHRRTATVRILLNQDLEARHRELELRLVEELTGDDRFNREPVAPDVAAEIVALEAEIEAAKVTFVVRAIGRKDWSDLVAKHPPTEAQRRTGARLDFNPESFPVAALAACAVDPEMTPAQAQRLEAAVNSSQFDTLWAAVLDVNVGGLSSPKSLIAGRIHRPSGASVTTAAAEESPEASSLAE